MCCGGSTTKNGKKTSWTFKGLLEKVKRAKPAENKIHIEPSNSFEDVEDKVFNKLYIEAVEKAEQDEDKEALKRIIKELNPSENFKGTGRRSLKKWAERARELIKINNDKSTD